MLGSGPPPVPPLLYNRSLKKTQWATPTVCAPASTQNETKQLCQQECLNVCWIHPFDLNLVHFASSELYSLMWDFLLSQINIWTSTTWSNVWVVLPKPSWYEFLIGFLIWTPLQSICILQHSPISVWFYPCSYICNCLKMPKKSQINEYSDNALPSRKCLASTRKIQTTNWCCIDLFYILRYPPCVQGDSWQNQSRSKFFQVKLVICWYLLIFLY